MSVCAAPTCSHQGFDRSSYYVDVDVDNKMLVRVPSDFITSEYILGAYDKVWYGIESQNCCESPISMSLSYLKSFLPHESLCFLFILHAELK